MPRFYFNVYDGVSQKDLDGTDLPNSECVRQEAISFAGSILQNETTKVMACADWHLEVADDEGAIIVHLALSLRQHVPLGELAT